MLIFPARKERARGDIPATARSARESVEAVAELLLTQPPRRGDSCKPNELLPGLGLLDLKCIFKDDNKRKAPSVYVFLFCRDQISSLDCLNNCQREGAAMLARSYLDH